MILFGFVAVGYPFVLLWAGEANANAFVIALLLFIPTILPSIQNLGIEILRAKYAQIPLACICACRRA